MWTVTLTVFLAILLAIPAVNGWIRLQNGYSLAVSISSGPELVTHIDFPTWRKLAHLGLWGAALAALALFAAGYRSAPVLLWLVFLVTIALGVADVNEYGTIGSPTSIWTVLLLFLAGLAPLLRSRLP